MRTKNYLPLAAYRIGAVAAALQIALALSVVVVTSPGYRTFHAGMAGVHLAVLVLWLYLYGKAKRAGRVQPAKVMPLSMARGLVKSAGVTVFALVGMALFAGYMVCAPDPHMPYPHSQWQPGSILTALGMLVNALMVAGIMLTVALQQLAEAKLGAQQLQGEVVEQGQNIAPTRAMWWTQDETRQELRRK